MEPTKKATKVNVHGGPSKYDLETALMFRKYPIQSVDFKIQDPDLGEIQIEIKIESIARTDPRGQLRGVEGHWWNIIGSTVGLSKPFDLFGTALVRIQYSTKYRAGWMQEISPEEHSAVEAALGFPLPHDT